MRLAPPLFALVHRYPSKSLIVRVCLGCHRSGPEFESRRPPPFFFKELAPLPEELYATQKLEINQRVPKSTDHCAFHSQQMPKLY